MSFRLLNRDRLPGRRLLVLCATVVLCIWTATLSRAESTALPLQTYTYQSSTADFANPERGFLHFRSLTSPWGYDTVRSEGHTLIYGQIVADAFRSGPLSQAFLDQIQAGFDQARANGLKVKPRFAYNDDGGADAPKSVILAHIQQLQPLWEANKDVIFQLDAGFIGAWGEWHSSTNGLDNYPDRTEILNAILAAFPEDRMIGIRTPHFKRGIFNGSPTDDTLKITEANAFDGSNLSRVGHLNDCFLASATDYGTYVTPGWSRQDEIDYIGGESRFCPHGGETCAVSTYSTGTNAISEMSQMHTDYLNIDYHPDVIQNWVDDGNFDEISKRLGYRYELKSAEMPIAVKPTGVLEIGFTIDNVGFGELFNPRQVQVTLENNTTGEITAAPLGLDPRFWSGGTTNEVHTYLTIPADMAEGTYTVGLRMPDFEDSLKDDVRYSVRFANENVWDSSTGINKLSQIEIASGIPGPTYEVGTEFEEISDPASLRLLGDLDSDSDVDIADLLNWQSGNGDTYGAAELGGWQNNFGAGDGASAATGVVPEPGATTAIGLALLQLLLLRAPLLP